MALFTLDDGTKIMMDGSLCNVLLHPSGRLPIPDGVYVTTDGLKFETVGSVVVARFGFASSGFVHPHTSGICHEEKQKNCDNCGSNNIVAYECQHCGTWFGTGAKPKRTRLPEVQPERIEKYQHQKPKGFFSRLFGSS